MRPHVLIKTSSRCCPPRARRANLGPVNRCLASVSPSLRFTQQSAWPKLLRQSSLLNTGDDLTHDPGVENDSEKLPVAQHCRPAQFQLLARALVRCHLAQHQPVARWPWISAMSVAHSTPSASPFGQQDTEVKAGMLPATIRRKTSVNRMKRLMLRHRTAMGVPVGCANQSRVPPLWWRSPGQSWRRPRSWAAGSGPLMRLPGSWRRAAGSRFGRSPFIGREVRTSRLVGLVRPDELIPLL
jgi:hypothetical protein